MNRLRILLDSISLIVSLLCVSVAASLAIGGACMAALLALGFGVIPDFLILTLWIIIPAGTLGGGIFLTWKFSRQTTVAEETESRGQSLLQWETAAFLLFYLLFVISFITDLDWPVLVGLSLPLAALTPALVFPFRYAKNGYWSMIRCIGLIGAFSIFFWGILILGRTGKTVSYRGHDPAAIPRSVQWIAKRYIPAGATKIELSGRSTACKWSCQVSKQDFLKFKESADTSNSVRS